MPRKGEFRSLAERFWPKVRKSDGCWEWQGNRQPFGYGTIQPQYPVTGSILTHRAAWELTNGPIPDGLWVLHHCDNPPCVRPDHLYLGRAKDNSADRTSRGRDGGPHRRGEGNGRAKLTAAQVAEIRALYRPSRGRKTPTSQTSLGARFGISQTVVSLIVRGRIWK